jgi:hypothetical protein
MLVVQSFLVLVLWPTYSDIVASVADDLGYVLQSNKYKIEWTMLRLFRRTKY